MKYLLKNLNMILMSWLFVTQSIWADQAGVPDVSDWEKPFLETLKKYQNDESEEAMRGIGRVAELLSIPYKKEPHRKQSDAYRLAVGRLREIPGAVEYFKRDILKRMEWDMGCSAIKGDEDRDSNFHILAQLQLPETVSVLGELLYDDRDPSKGPPSDSPYVPNSLYATLSLHKLGIKHPPVNSRDFDARRDLPAWRLWYEQVKAGNRTFSFVGDEKTYTLAGAGTMVPEKKVRPDRKSNNLLTGSPASVSGKTEGPGGWMIPAFVGFLFCLLVGYWFKKRLG